jgi:hypothetical protein
MLRIAVYELFKRPGGLMRGGGLGVMRVSVGARSRPRQHTHIRAAHRPAAGRWVEARASAGALASLGADVAITSGTGSNVAAGDFGKNRSGPAKHSWQVSFRSHDQTAAVDAVLFDPHECITHAREPAADHHAQRARRTRAANPAAVARLMFGWLGRCGGVKANDLMQARIFSACTKRDRANCG